MTEVPPAKTQTESKASLLWKMIPLVASTSQSSPAASIFGGAKPVDTAAREGEIEEWPQKEQEKLQHQLDEPELERLPWERHLSWRSQQTRGHQS